MIMYYINISHFIAVHLGFNEANALTMLTISQLVSHHMLARCFKSPIDIDYVC